MLYLCVFLTQDIFIPQLIRIKMGYMADTQLNFRSWSDKFSKYLE